MRQKPFLSFIVLCIFLSFRLSFASGVEIPKVAADGNPSVEFFSPQGTAKGVRQVSVRFSEPIVPFGDPRLAEPFIINCPEKGQARWADAKNWVFDFDRDLPAGIACDFSLKSGFKTLSGKDISGQTTFSFSTGGPAVLESYPFEGSRNIDEEQVFVLTLDAEPSGESVLSNVSCSVEGINERIGVRIIGGVERKSLLDSLQRTRREGNPIQILLQCRQRFPGDSRVRLIWGKGTASLSGVPTEEEQVFDFRTRSPFTASFSCERENPKADCIPILPLRLRFSSPVPSGQAGEIVLKSPSGKIYRASLTYERGEDEEENAGDAGNKKPEFVNTIYFHKPLPENTTFTLEIPKTIKDDAGRDLENMDKFPLTVRTDSYPPLAKFSARFGIIELKGDATLPVTVRNLESKVKTRLLKVENGEKGIMDKASEGLLDKAVRLGESINSILPGPLKEKGDAVVEGLKGRLHKVRIDKETEVIEWLRTVAATGRERSIFKGEKAKDFSVPKPAGPRAFEVVGIPLKEAGLYVVEMESRILGKALLGEQRPMYVPTAALVTNLSAHFKWGGESSLVWVTTLDKAEPVKNAAVSVRDCTGRIIWEGKSDANGIALIRKRLPSGSELANCPIRHDSSSYRDWSQSTAIDGLGWGLFVFAKTKDDMTFVHSSWDQGIEPWRFGLPGELQRKKIIAHTIMDRPLFRAGETVHMKHVIRKQALSGFSLVPKNQLPKTVLIRHAGSNQMYEFPLKWDSKNIAETTWKIPVDAKLGKYRVYLLESQPGDGSGVSAEEFSEEGDEFYIPDGWNSGLFRVEEFRLPVMKGIIQPPKDPLINASEAGIDLAVSYLSGGAAGSIPVKLRSRVQDRLISFDEYEGFHFGSPEIREGISRGAYQESEETPDTGETRENKSGILSSSLLLEKTGSLRTKIQGLPHISSPQEILTELEFRDPNGEIQTVSAKIPLWPSKLILGIKPDSWAASKESFKFHVVALDITGRPAPDTAVAVDLLQKKYYSHRKRLIGGFYSYEHMTEITKAGRLCEGKTDSRGLLICELKTKVSGNVIIQARAKDDAGNESFANHEAWIAGRDEWWFDVADSDRIDLLPEKKRYEPGEKARFQVRMPFRNATALVTVEREGIIDSFVRRLSGKEPVVELPLKAGYAPNVFVSVLCVRGRVAGIQPTALVDLGKPAYKLGIAEINVGWKSHELNVQVIPDRRVYKIREKAKIKIRVRTSEDKIPPKGAEAAIAAVDEGLLELMPNRSWQILQAMMGRRGYEVNTSTAQSQVVGKRHYGLKALPHGGGGGRQATRELFDTLLLWKGRVALDANGEASVEVPLNDSLTSFRITAVAVGGSGLFGTGQADIKTTQDLMLLSGVPPVVREEDGFRAVFTVRNASERTIDAEISALLHKGGSSGTLEAAHEKLSPGEAKEITWNVVAPSGTDSLVWEVTAREGTGEGSDRLKVKQKVVPSIPVRTFQATITQVAGVFDMDIERPKDALQKRGGINISFNRTISAGLDGVRSYMKSYPYACMEQKTSRAIALGDEGLWKVAMAELPSYLDADGLVKYFPVMLHGSDILTSYMLSISAEAGWSIPPGQRKIMEEGLKKFVEGRLSAYSPVSAADLSIRKMAAIEALSRYGKAEAKMLDSIPIDPNLWPTSAVMDWVNVLLRIPDIRDRDKRLRESEQIIRSRLNFQGTTMGFSTERTDGLWWLMISSDVNAVRSILTFAGFENWKEDMPRLVQGATGRQHRGTWDTTTANAWGVLAMKRFSKMFESVPVNGKTSAEAGQNIKSVDWRSSAKNRTVSFGWQKEKEKLHLSHQGSGRPWATIQSLAAVPLKAPFSSGYKIKKILAAVEQKDKGKWSKGDVIKVRLDLEAQADMAWVVVNDPIPAGAGILGTGLGRDSELMAGGGKEAAWVRPVFEERSFEAFRAYYEFVPKGKWSVEYTFRLNNAGSFHLPETRVEALYAPEIFGELPNNRIEVE